MKLITDDDLWWHSQSTDLPFWIHCRQKRPMTIPWLPTTCPKWAAPLASARTRCLLSQWETAPEAPPDSTTPTRACSSHPDRSPQGTCVWTNEQLSSPLQPPVLAHPTHIMTMTFMMMMTTLQQSHLIRIQCKLLLMPVRIILSPNKSAALLFFCARVCHFWALSAHFCMGTGRPSTGCTEY